MNFYLSRFPSCDLLTKQCSTNILLNVIECFSMVDDNRTNVTCTSSLSHVHISVSFLVAWYFNWFQLPQHLTFIICSYFVRLLFSIFVFFFSLFSFLSLSRCVVLCLIHSTTAMESMTVKWTTWVTWAPCSWLTTASISHSRTSTCTRHRSTRSAISNRKPWTEQPKPWNDNKHWKSKSIVV